MNKTAADLKVGDKYWTGPNQWTVQSVEVGTKTVEVQAVISGGFVGFQPGNFRVNRHRRSTKLAVSA